MFTSTTETTTAVPTVEVRIRSHEYPSTEAVYLCHATVGELDALVRDVCKWGVYVDSSGTDPYTEASGQFAITDAAFFEIVLRDSIDA